MADIVQAMDQVEAVVLDTAAMLARYYMRLIEGGVPEPLAVSLATQFSMLWWTKNMFPNMNPMTDEE